MNSSPSTGPSEGARRKPFDAEGFFVRRSPVILFGGLLIALLLVPILGLRMKPHYEASGALLIDVSKEITLAGREREIVPSNIGDYVRTTVNRLASVDVLEEALSNVPPDQWPCHCSSNRSTVRNAVALLKSLTVREEPRSFIIVASLSAEKPDGLGTMVNAVMQAFLKKLRAEQELQSAHRLTYLRAERARVEERMEQQRVRLMEISDRVSTRAVLQSDYTLHLSSLDQVQKLAWEATAELARREAARDQALSDEGAIGALSLTPYAQEKVAGNEGINRIEQWTYEQLQSLRSQIDGLTAQNRDRQYVEERMVAMKQYLEAHKNRVNEKTNQFLVEKRAYDLKFDVLRSESAYEAAKQTLKTVDEHLGKARSQASELGDALFSASEIHHALEHLRNRLASLNNRIDDCEMEAKSPIKISIERRASDPVLPARSAGRKAVIASVLVGFGMMGGVCLGFELMDGRVRSVRHVDAALGGRSSEALVGEIFGSGLGVGEGSQELWRGEMPWARALRSLAVRLENQRKAHGTRVFMVSGASRGCGATTIAINLAGALGDLVRRVLFVEVQSGRQPIGTFSGCNGMCLEKALDDVPGWMEAKCGEEKLCVLTASSKGSANPRGIRELLALAREGFDMIVVNTAPIGEDDLADFVSLEVDGAVIVAREDETRYRQLFSALERLKARPVSAVTAVLHRFGKRETLRPMGALLKGFGVLQRFWRVRRV